MKKLLLKKGIKLLFLGMALAGNAMAQNLLTNNPSFEAGTGSGPGISLGGVWYRTINGNSAGADQQIYRQERGQEPSSFPTAQQGSAYLKAVTPSGAPYDASYKLQAVNSQSLNSLLTVGNTYKLSFYYQNTVGHTFKVGLQDNAGNAPYEFFTTVNSTSDVTTWTLVEYSFTVTADLIVASNDIRITLQFGANAGTTLIDNVQLVNTTPIVGGSNLLLNPSFESGAFSSWTAYSNSAVTEVSTPITTPPTLSTSQDGNKHVKVDIPATIDPDEIGNAWKYQFLTAAHFTIVPTHTYRVSFWYKANKDFRVMLQNSQTVQADIKTPASIWTKYEVDLIIPANEQTSTSLKFHFNFGAAAGTIELDNISVIDLTALPVTLTSFSAKANLNAIAINWKTETESNASHFELLRAGEDGNFKYLTNVTAKNVGSIYNFTDNIPLKGKNYYKLLQYDLDGKVNEIKEIASANFGINSVDLALYPNPAINKFSFDLNGYAGKNINVQLSDITGKTLKTEILNATAGVNTVSLPQGLNSGLYFVKISGKDLSKTSKLLVK